MAGVEVIPKCPALDLVKQHAPRGGLERRPSTHNTAVVEKSFTMHDGRPFYSHFT